MARPRQDRCKRGHPLADAHVTTTSRGLKRTCRKCRHLRHKKYHAFREREPKPAAVIPPT